MEAKENKFIGYIYGLYDPRTDELRYIGYTTKSLEERLYFHIKESVYKNKTYKTKWINKLISENINPIIKSIEKLELNDFDILLDKLWSLEDFYIQTYKNSEVKLTNSKDGGKGGKFSKESRKKMSEAQSGEKSAWWGRLHKEESKRKISLANKNKIVSEETRKKIGEKSKNRTLSKKTREKISNSLKGEKNHFYGKKHTEESRKKISLNHHNVKGENNHFAKLNFTTINEIRNLYLKGIKRIYLKEKYKIPDGTLGKIINNYTWKDVLYENLLKQKRGK